MTGHDGRPVCGFLNCARLSGSGGMNASRAVVSLSLIGRSASRRSGTCAPLRPSGISSRRRLMQEGVLRPRIRDRCQPTPSVSVHATDLDGRKAVRQTSGPRVGPTGRVERKKLQAAAFFARLRPDERSLLSVVAAAVVRRRRAVPPLPRVRGGQRAAPDEAADGCSANKSALFTARDLQVPRIAQTPIASSSTSQKARCRSLDNKVLPPRSQLPRRAIDDDDDYWLKRKRWREGRRFCASRWKSTMTAASGQRVGCRDGRRGNGGRCGRLQLRAKRRPLNRDRGLGKKSTAKCSSDPPSSRLWRLIDSARRYEPPLPQGTGARFASRFPLFDPPTHTTTSTSTSAMHAAATARRHPGPQPTRHQSKHRQPVGRGSMVAHRRHSLSKIV